MSATLEAKVLEQKLLLREVTAGGTKTTGTVTKIANKLFKYLNSLNETTSQNDTNETNLSSSNVEGVDDYETLIKEIKLYQYEMNKVNYLFDISTKEIASYNDLKDSINGKVLLAKSEIANLEKELDEEQLIREHRLQCEGLASKFNNLPATALLHTTIVDMENTLLGDKDSVLAIEQGIQQRANQFDQLMDSFNSLISKLGGNDDTDNNDMNVVDYDDQPENYSSTRDGNDEGRDNIRMADVVMITSDSNLNDM